VAAVIPAGCGGHILPPIFHPDSQLAPLRQATLRRAAKAEMLVVEKAE